MSKKVYLKTSLELNTYGERTPCKGMSLAMFLGLVSLLFFFFFPLDLMLNTI